MARVSCDARQRKAAGQMNGLPRPLAGGGRGRVHQQRIACRAPPPSPLPQREGEYSQVTMDLAADIAARTDSYFNRTQGDRRAVRRQARHLCGVPAPAGDLRAAADDRMAADRSRGARHHVRHRPDVSGRRLGRCRRAAGLHHRQPGAAVRSGNDPAAEDRPRLRRRAQRLPDVPGAAGGRLPGDGSAALRRRRDAGHDGLCRLGRQRLRRSARAPRASSATPTTAPRIGSARRAASARCRTR